jgi:hypothetical protein
MTQEPNVASLSTPRRHQEARTKFIDKKNPVVLGKTNGAKQNSLYPASKSGSPAAQRWELPVGYADKPVHRAVGGPMSS